MKDPDFGKVGVEPGTGAGHKLDEGLGKGTLFCTELVDFGIRCFDLSRDGDRFRGWGAR